MMCQPVSQIGYREELQREGKLYVAEHNLDGSIHEPDLGADFNHDGKRAKRANGSARASAKPNIPDGRSEPVAGCNGLNQQQTDDRSCT